MSDQQLDNLEIAEVASLTNKQVDEFKEIVEQKDATENDLEQLIEAEKAGKGRDEVVEFLKGMINKNNVEEKLDTALSNLEDLEVTIDEVDQLENSSDLDDQDEVELDQSQIIELIEGTVDELKEYVNENFLYRRQLEEILDAEKAGKNRKTAKRFLNKKIENKGIEEEIKESKEDLQRLKKDIENLHDHFENVADSFDYSSDERDEESQEAANELLEITNSIIQDLKQSDNINNRENLEKKTNEVIQALQNDNYGKVRDALIEISQMGYEDEGENDEEAQQKMEEQDEKLERMKEIVDDIQESEEDIQEDLQEQSHGPNFEQKKKLAQNLRTDFSDKDLEEITLQELQELKREQKHREEIIEKLKQSGLEEKDLRDSSTSDLEKLLETSNSMEDRTEKFEEQSDKPDKSAEEIRQEAEQDLESLQGAVSAESQQQEEQVEEESGPSAKERLGGFTEQIKDRLSSSKEENSDGMKEDKVRRLLEDYRDIENDQEASVKIAHVMKSYLESQLNVQREMTYRELAERIPTDENEEMRQLSNFFQKMHKQEYTDSIQIDDIDEVIDNCEAVLEKMR
jgi:hypothetical protein